jgi:erythromycin esterase-like protein
MSFRLLVVSLLILQLLLQSRDSEGSDFELVSSVVADACDHNIVILGEASHGDGVAFELKTKIVDRLIRECGFKAFFIESGVYDFARIADIRNHQPNSNRLSDMARAVGGLWSNFQEITRLIEILHTSHHSRLIDVFGLDYQVGSKNYASSEMSKDLTSVLDIPISRYCFKYLDDFIYWRYSERTPFSTKHQFTLLWCLEEITRKLDLQSSTGKLYMNYVTNLQALVIQYVLSLKSNELFNYRDLLMAKNFVHGKSNIDPSAKSIVWTHNIHAAKFVDDLRPQHKSMANNLQENYREEVFSIAFTAYSGEYQTIGNTKPVKIGPAPNHSLEAILVGKSQNLGAYCNQKCLRELGLINTGIDYYHFKLHRPAAAFDGVVVIRTEKSPTIISKQN